MNGYLCFILHGHLPFVRHPEFEKALEESWFFEAVCESYIPLLQVLERWRHDAVPARLALTLTPTLCAMFLDPLLQERCRRHLDKLVELAEKELHRTLWEPQVQAVARFYHERLLSARDYYARCNLNLLSAFRAAQDAGQLEVLTSAATHALLPLLVNHPPSLRAQIRIGCAFYRECFGREPRGVWLPECAYVPELEPVLREAKLQWFPLESHGLLNARPLPRFGMFAPVITPGGLAAFGRDPASARQVWSRHEGYPGDPRYRDFYRDIGFDLDLEYVRPHLSAPDHRGFTGLKYHRITGGTQKSVYDRTLALKAAEEHASHFLAQRARQANHLFGIMHRPPVLVAPYDAELFGHWWYEGPEFLDFVARKASREAPGLRMTTPGEYLAENPTQQLAMPGTSSWGEGGYWKVWLNESNEWVYRSLQPAQERMTLLANSHQDPTPLEARALRQAGRELLLAQASDWPFILKAGTSPAYAEQRVKTHLERFDVLATGLSSGKLDESFLARVEDTDNLFPNLDWQAWRTVET